MPMKMSLISSSTTYIGCLWPICVRLPGIVTSTASLASFRSSSRALSSSLRCARAFSTSARTWFASWPMAGRSLGSSLPIILSSFVRSPFLPRYWMRRASSACGSAAPRMAFTATSRRSWSIFFMFTSPYLNCVSNKKINLSSRHWDERHSSAVPPEFDAAASHSNAVTGVPAGDWPELTGEPSTGSARRFQPPTSLSAPDRGVLFSRSKPYNMYNSTIYSTVFRKKQAYSQCGVWSVECGV